MHEIPHLDRAAYFARMDQRLKAVPFRCLAMYSSYVGGLVTDPALMLVPVEDHVVHRGDGVFETLKCVTGGLYNLDAHLQRLERSAQGIGMVLPVSLDVLTRWIKATVRATGRDEALVRVLAARGPGGLGVSPRECPEPQIYIMAAPLPLPFMERKPAGGRAGFSAFPPKSARMAEMKTCNYLSNALMAAEAVERGLDFVFSLSADDHVLEGPTENMAMVTGDGELVTPPGVGLLSGTTLERVMALAVENEIIPARRRSIHRDELSHARELWVCGTTTNVTAITQFEGRPVGPGQPGPMRKALDEALAHDIYKNPAMRSRIDVD